jgi:cytochrome c
LLLVASWGTPAHADAGDPQRGRRVFQKCYACHSVDPGETNLPGPNLNGVIGRKAASLPGFEYSNAMIAAGQSGVVWDEATLDRFIGDAERVMPGTIMGFPGLKDPVERADVIAYLRASARSLTD